MKEEQVERIEKAFKSLEHKLDQLIEVLDNFGKDKKSKKKQEEVKLSPFQEAVKIATAKNSSDEEVKKSLELFGQSSQQLTPSQMAFVLFFLALNKAHLAEEVKWMVGLEVGKRKFNDRDLFIEATCRVLEEKYRSNMTIVNGLKVFLSDYRKK